MYESKFIAAMTQPAKLITIQCARPTIYKTHILESSSVLENAQSVILHY